MISAVLRLKSPAVRRPDVIEALRSLMRKARAEQGLVSAEIALDVDDENAIRYEERWETGADLEYQVRSSRFTQLLAVMESASEEPRLEFDFVSQTRGLEYVAAVRGARLEV